MYAGTSNPRAPFTVPEWLRIRRLLFAVPIAIIVVPLALVATILGYMTAFPAHSATAEISALKARLTLQFYYVWGDDDQGRRLTIETPTRRTRLALNVFDWAHNARTSIYTTPDGGIAVLNAMGEDDRVVSPMAGTTSFPPTDASDEWTYVGAFDLAFADNAPQLRFISANEQAECVPMRSENRGTPRSARNAARYRDCPPYVVPSARP
jgi:hypothetical protein